MLPMPQVHRAPQALHEGGRMNFSGLFLRRAGQQPAAMAITDGAASRTYAELAHRVARLAGALRGMGLQRGERVAVWSENRIEYVELELAAAQLGLVVACLNWRLSDAEQLHCIKLVAPALVVVSPRYAAALRRLDDGAPRVLELGPDFERLVETAPLAGPDPDVDAEDGLLILYTSGTTGLPKGALISQRAMIARAQMFASDYGIHGGDSFIAWSPLFHMAATDHSLATLLLGGKVIVCDGLDLNRICGWLRSEPSVGWLLAMPGMIEPLIAALYEVLSAGGTIAPVKLVGAMADLVPPQQIAELSRLVNAPYLNSFGSTETGLPPASGGVFAPGVAPSSFSKRQSAACQVRLLDADGAQVPLESPGEMAVSGPTLFSGYWGDAQATARDLHGGWFHMGDVFVRHADGTLDFVDRLKYLIKSGGENIYPAEIEHVLLSHPSVRDAAVVRRRDAHWGEVPVAFVARADEALHADALLAFCRERLPGYKVPKDIRFLAVEDLPRSSTGKIQRHELEKRL
jgi:acyl-CoA synthetase (AMP-forming)/AMP-acid ligase II